MLRKTLPPPEASDPREGDDGDEGSAADGQDRSWELPEAADVGGLTEFEAGVVRQRVAIDYRAHKGERGDTPGEFGRWLRRMTEPTLPWETLLAQAVRRGVGWTSGRTHTTYTRPNRRAASTPGVVLPGWRRPQPQVACVVDTSGSVDDALLARAMSEVEGALRQLGRRSTCWRATPPCTRSRGCARRPTRRSWAGWHRPARSTRGGGAATAPPDADGGVHRWLDAVARNPTCRVGGRRGPPGAPRRGDARGACVGDRRPLRARRLTRREPPQAQAGPSSG